MSETEYRYVAACGVERKRSSAQGDRPRRDADSWVLIDGQDLHGMTAAELRKVADAMDGGVTITMTDHEETVDWADIRHQYAPEAPSDHAAAVGLFRDYVTDPRNRCLDYIRLTHSEARHVLAALDRATAETEEQYKEMVRDGGRIRDLQAQVKKRDDELTFEQTFRKQVAKRSLELEGELADLRAQLAARTDATPLKKVEITHFWIETTTDGRTQSFATPASDVYEHAPRPVAPDYELVGACVVRDAGERVNAFTLGMFSPQDICEMTANVVAKKSGGTAHRLYRGEPITEVTP